MQTWQDIQNCPFQSQKSVKDHLASAQGHLILPPPLANLCSMRSHAGYKNQIFLMPSVGIDIHMSSVPQCLTCSVACGEPVNLL